MKRLSNIFIGIGFVLAFYAAGGSDTGSMDFTTTLIFAMFSVGLMLLGAYLKREVSQSRTTYTKLERQEKTKANTQYDYSA